MEIDSTRRCIGKLILCIATVIGGAYLGTNSTQALEPATQTETSTSSKIMRSSTPNTPTASDRDGHLKKRLISIAIIVGTFIASLGVAYGYLKIELLTRGFHSGRLQLLAMIVLVAQFLAAYYLWTVLVSR